MSAQGASFDVGRVEELFAISPPGTTRYYYDVSPDGQRFLVSMVPEVNAAPTPITVVLNWTGITK